MPNSVFFFKCRSCLCRSISNLWDNGKTAITHSLRSAETTYQPVVPKFLYSFLPSTWYGSFIICCLPSGSMCLTIGLASIHSDQILCLHCYFDLSKRLGTFPLVLIGKIAFRSGAFLHEFSHPERRGKLYLWVYIFFFCMYIVKPNGGLWSGFLHLLLLLPANILMSHNDNV